MIMGFVCDFIIPGQFLQTCQDYVFLSFSLFLCFSRFSFWLFYSFLLSSLESHFYSLSNCFFLSFFLCLYFLPELLEYFLFVHSFSAFGYLHLHVFFFPFFFCFHLKSHAAQKQEVENFVFLIFFENLFFCLTSICQVCNVLLLTKI